MDKKHIALAPKLTASSNVRKIIDAIPQKGCLEIIQPTQNPIRRILRLRLVFGWRYEIQYDSNEPLSCSPWWPLQSQEVFAQIVRELETWDEQNP